MSERWEDAMLEGVLSSGSRFEASAHPFAEFSLSSGQDEIFRLQYVFDSAIEKLGGVAYQGDYLGRRWTLQFFRTPYLQREFYRVLCDGALIAATEVFQLLRPAKVIFSDQTTWHCHVRILGLEVKNSEGSRILHTLARPGLMLGGSSLHIDHAVELDRALPLLIILLHSSTHHST